MSRPVPPSHPQIYTVAEVIHPRVFDCPTCGKSFYVRDAIVQRDGSLQCRECSADHGCYWRDYRWCPRCQQAKQPGAFVNSNGWARTECASCVDASLHPAPIVNVCQQCGESFTPKRRDAKYCSCRCRVAAHRQAPASHEAGKWPTDV